MTAPYTPIAPEIDDPTIFPALSGQGFPTKTPIWSTGIATASSGRERRRRLWSYPKWQIKIAYEVLQQFPTLDEVNRFVGFFNSQSARYGAFDFFDAADNLVTDQFIADGDGTTTVFQLLRVGGFGEMTWVEPVKAVLGTPKISVGGADTTAFTLGDLGRITFASPPTSGAAIEWSGQFMFRCRFDQDSVDVVQMMESLFSQDGITIVTDKR